MHALARTKPDQMALNHGRRSGSFVVYVAQLIEQYLQEINKLMCLNNKIFM